MSGLDLSVSLPKLGRLVRVDLQTIWETEAQDFTPWLTTVPKPRGCARKFARDRGHGENTRVLRCTS